MFTRENIFIVLCVEPLYCQLSGLVLFGMVNKQLVLMLATH